MRKKGIVLSLFLLAAILSVAFFVWFHFLKSKKAQISIETIPTSEVLINGEKVGQSPFEKELKAGDITLKLIPLSSDKPLTTFEAKILVSPGIKTIVRREFGEIEEDSSGEIISFTKDNSQQDSSISVISIPDSTEVYLNNTLQGTAPYKISALIPGKYELLIKGQGLKEKKITVQTISGYTTLVTAYLSQDPNFTLSPSPSPTPSPNKKIKVIDTGTGFLRVRSGPSTLDKEIGQVKPGETFELLDPEDVDGWYKIKYSDDTEGWVSMDYVEIVEN